MNSILGALLVAPILSVLPWMVRRPVARARQLALLGNVWGLVGTLLYVALRAGGGLPSLRHLASTELAFVDYLAPIFVNVVGLIVLSLSSTAVTSPRTFVRIVLLEALALLTVSSPSPVVAVMAWCIAVGTVWGELEDLSARRAFALFHILGIGLAIVALVYSSYDASAAAGIFLASLVIREALIPAHVWLPKMAQRVHLGVLVMFVAPQLGAFMHVSAVAPHLDVFALRALVLLGIATAVLCALLAAAQSNPRSMLAYLFVSESGLIVFGLENHSPVGLAGAGLMWVVQGIGFSGFAMCLAALEARRGRQRLGRPRGNFAETPKLGAAFLVLGLASVGLPGTLGFIAEDLLVQGSIDEFPMYALMLIGVTALNSVTVVRAFFSLFSGTRQRSGCSDLSVREHRALTLAMGTLLITGLVPGMIFAAYTPH